MSTCPSAFDSSIAKNRPAGGAISFRISHVRLMMPQRSFEESPRPIAKANGIFYQRKDKSLFTPLQGLFISRWISRDLWLEPMTTTTKLSVKAYRPVIYTLVKPASLQNADRVFTNYNLSNLMIFVSACTESYLESGKLKKIKDTLACISFSSPLFFLFF